MRPQRQRGGGPCRGPPLGIPNWRGGFPKGGFSRTDPWKLEGVWKEFGRHFHGIWKESGGSLRPCRERAERLPRSPLFKNFRRVRLRFGAWGSPKGGFSTTVHASTREAIWISLWFNGCLCFLEGGRSEYLGDFFEGGRAAVLQGRAFRKKKFFSFWCLGKCLSSVHLRNFGFFGFFWGGPSQD